MSDEFSEYRLMIMKEQESMGTSIRDMNKIMTDHMADYNLFKGKIWGAVITLSTIIPVVVSVVAIAVSTNMSK